MIASGNNVVPFFIRHQGCPFRCIYCDQHLTAAAKESGMSEILPGMMAAIDIYGRTGEKPQLAFYGGTFTAIPQERQRQYLDAAAKLVDQGLISSLRLSTRPDAIGEAELDLLQKYPVSCIELGAQSLDDEVLMASRRGYTAEAVYRSSKMIRLRGIKLGLQLMPGLPGDDADSIKQSAVRTVEIGPDMVRVYPTVVLRGTALAKMYRRGDYRPLPLEEMVDICADLLELFSWHKIDVIRMGLQATSTLNSNEVVSGPYHPAFGQLVESRAIRRKAEELLGNQSSIADVPSFKIARGRQSDFIGQNRGNVVYLCEKFGLSNIKIMEDNHLARGELQLVQR